jgi:hypothetical protein
MFPSSGEGRETPAMLVPLVRANLNHWIVIMIEVSSKRPSSLDIFLPSPEGFLFFGIQFYLQAVRVHSANCVKLQRRVEERSVALLHIQQVQGLVCL